MCEIPASNNSYIWWESQNVEVMNSAAKKLVETNVNPWVLCGDTRHFEQFADQQDHNGIATLSFEESNAVFGCIW